MTNSVLTIAEVDNTSISALLHKYNLILTLNPDNDAIPGSFWGESEAGLVGNQLHVRNDTPIHSLLHESCHYICMDEQRRTGLHTDAGGDYDEENAVCYLQIILSAQIDNMDSQRMMDDMDIWGYTFRLGSAQQWFEKDAEDAQQWLIDHHILDSHNQPTFQLRQ